MSLKSVMLLFFVMSLSSILVAQNSNKSYSLEALEAQERRATGDKSIVTVSDDVYKSRLAQISNQFPMKFTPTVKSYIKRYTERGRSSSERIIGRSSIYFSIFETALMRHNVPTDLKYLAIVESALDPKAVSPVGATGLWQFMAGTGKMYGLRISKAVDERRDPYMASDAAARYLASLYKRYNDWPLAIAAYNCGEGNVNKAIRNSGHKNYWKLKGYLPKETRNYVPAYIAVSYMMNYYHEHNIYPEYPEYDYQYTDHVRVYKRMTLSQIATATQTPLSTVKFLNPGYKSGYVPASKTGYVVGLPLKSMAAFRAFYPEAKPAWYNNDPVLAYENTVVSHTRSGSVLTTNEIVYTVRQGDNLAKLANRYHCTVSDLRRWNNISGSLLRIGQRLTIKEKKYVPKPPATVVEEQIIASTPAPVEANIAQNIPTPEVILADASPKSGAILTYKVQTGDSLWKIANANNMTVSDLMSKNGLNSQSKLYPGMKLTIK